MYSFGSIMIDNEGRARPHTSKFHPPFLGTLFLNGELRVCGFTHPEVEVRVRAKRIEVGLAGNRIARAFFVTCSRKVGGSPCLEVNERQQVHCPRLVSQGSQLELYWTLRESEPSIK